MYEKRTDLALEVHELHGEESGIEIFETEQEGIRITTAVVKKGIGEKNSGKAAGNYLTIDVGKVWQNEKSRFDEIARVIADRIKSFLPSGEGCVLCVGLGNEKITSDSLGPLVVQGLLVTRHIKNIDEDFYNGSGFGCVAALETGVLAHTGVESAEIIKSICDRINPKCVIAVDALASRRLSRLATTVQLCDSGISPGSGVYNKRNEISEKTLGVPVISIGVPMVVDAATLAFDVLEEHKGGEDEGFENTVEKVLSGEMKNVFVTPKDVDLIVGSTARLISSALNIALHKIDLAEINEYVG